MDVLVLGGTQFVGRHIVEAMVVGEHCVSTLNRGRTPDELPDCVERLRGDRDEGKGGLGALRGRRWDVCVDVSGYTPRQVRASVEELSGRVGRYVFVSAVSVYGDPEGGPVTEGQKRLSPASEDVTEVTSNRIYGGCKVACEEIVRGVYAERCALLRPQIVVGPHEPGSRFGYWVWRSMQGGEMLGPGDGTDHLQVVDARDLARFTRLVVEKEIGGAFNVAGHRITWARFMEVIGARDIVWVDAGILGSAGIAESELPLYRRDGGERSSLMHVSNERAVGAGLRLTELEVTVAETRAWLMGRAATPPALEPGREAELIRMAGRR